MHVCVYMCEHVHMYVYVCAHMYVLSTGAQP